MRQGGLLKWERVLTTLGLVSTLLAGLAIVGCMIAVRLVLGRLRMNNSLELSPQDVAHLTAYFTPLRGAFGALLAMVAVGVAAVGLRTAPDAGRRRAVFLCASMLLLFLPLDVVMNPALNFAKSGRSFGQEIKKAASKGKTVYLYEENFSGVYNLYSGITHMEQIRGEAQLKQVLGERGRPCRGDGEAVLQGAERVPTDALPGLSGRDRAPADDAAEGHRPATPAGPEEGRRRGPADPRRLTRRAEAAGAGRTGIGQGSVPA